MSASMSLSRAVVGILVLGLLGASGCSWFRKGDRLQDPANRPLEAPPALELPRADAAGSAMASGADAPAPSAATTGFTTAGTRDAVFEKVGEALAATPGVTVASRAQLLGAFDVNYEGSNFLVRVSAVEAGAYVSAVDPRGLPASGDAPRKLMAALQAALGGN